MSALKLSLAAKLSEILGEVEEMKKEGRNVSQSYDYFTEGQVMAQLRQKLASRKIWLKTSVTKSERWEITSRQGSLLQFVSVDTKHTFIDGEGGEREECDGFGIGMDSGDKAGNKAITAAVKYCLMKSFFITDAADPENDSNFPPAKSEKPEPKQAPEEIPGNAQENIVKLRGLIDQEFMDEAYVIQTAFKANQCKETDDKLEDLKPGVLAVLVANWAIIVKNWQKHLRVLKKAREEKKGNGNGGQSEAAPDGNARKRGYSLAGGDRSNKAPAVKEPTRQPCQSDIEPADLLRQEGLGWRDVHVHFGKNKGKRLGDLTAAQLGFYRDDWDPQPFKGKISDKDIILDAALCVASAQ